MQGNAKVIETLNNLLAFELAAADQYFIHSQMYADWGLPMLYEHIHHEWQEELDHAKQLIERILFLEGMANMVNRDTISVGTDVPSMLKSDLTLEYDAVVKLKDAIALCETERDFQSRQILLGLLEDTEMDHAYWLEKQLGLIDKMGLQNYIEHAAKGGA
ncbi:bacterioferritin [Magnetovibrio blakemorei]|uniref:Bacterioferritin n=1 Tax=Magnetovibrio blakemorei TaxID=28181 RepID=A0A1E5QAQ5_9PROT|nr:bacterioferritin [Magnetovibrio blakemorei]OEJ69067.1 bacterioferritin [Magnetovibrio blakemorei]